MDNNKILWVNDDSLWGRMNRAVNIMISPKGNWYENAEKATSELVWLQLKDIPPQYHKLGVMVLGLRDRLKPDILVTQKRTYVGCARITSKQKIEWVEALLKLYECLMYDIGRANGYHPIEDYLDEAESDEVLES